MLPVKSMQFVTTKKDGVTTVAGKLSFNAVHRLTEHEINHIKFDLVGHVKENMQRQVWHECYAELIDPLHELEMTAVQSAAYHDVPRVRELARKIRELISFSP